MCRADKFWEQTTNVFVIKHHSRNLLIETVTAEDASASTIFGRCVAIGKSYVQRLFERTRQNYVSSQVNDVDEFKWVFSQIFRFVARNLH